MGVATKLDRNRSADGAMRADARRYLERTGNADLVEILGLTRDDEGAGFCPRCKKPLPKSGLCRRYNTCRKAPEETS